MKVFQKVLLKIYQLVLMFMMGISGALCVLCKFELKEINEINMYISILLCIFWSILLVILENKVEEE